jgi:hypothetical protein
MTEILGVTPEPLYYISAVAGFVMVAGGIWLIYKEKIYIDRETKAITEVETPFGKFKTNIPALVLFVLGFVPLIYPIIKSASTTPEVPLKGEVKSNTYPVDVYAVISSDSLKNQRSVNLSVPFLQGSTNEYKVLYVVGGILTEEQVVLTNKNAYKLTTTEFSPSSTMTFKPASVAEKPTGF